jgi:hypothetical protein
VKSGDFLTTSAFAALSVRGLDYAFIFYDINRIQMGAV